MVHGVGGQVAHRCRRYKMNIEYGDVQFGLKAKRVGCARESPLKGQSAKTGSLSITVKNGRPGNSVQTEKGVSKRWRKSEGKVREEEEGEVTRSKREKSRETGSGE